MLFAVAVMDLRRVAAFTVLITVDKLLPAPRFSRMGIGFVLLAIDTWFTGFEFAAGLRSSASKNPGLAPRLLLGTWSVDHCGCGLVPAGFAGIGAGFACPVVAGDVIGRVAWPVVVAEGLVAVFVFVPAKPKIRNRTTTIATAPAIHPQDDP